VGGRGRGKFSPKRLRQRETRLKAIALRRQGLTFAQIAERLGYKDRASCYMSLKYELDQQRAADVEMLRELEGRRLDEVNRAIWPRVISGQDLEATKLFVRISARRAALFGLDARQPVGGGQATAQASVTVQVGGVEDLADGELAALLARLERGDHS
jgi:hypothetical protein